MASSLTSNNATPSLVTVFGGSGFVGRYVVSELARRGYRVRVACRRPDLAGHLKPLGDVGQIHCVQANLRYRWSVERAVEDADAVINLVGILAESGQQTFESVQSRGAGWVAEEAARRGAHLVQMSAIGADENSNAEYARTKAAGEAAVLKACPGAAIVRPSIVFGPEDEFFNRFAAMAKFAPALPLIGGGKTLFQPVYVGDVAKAIANLVDLGPQSTQNPIWELGGPEVLSFKACMERMLDVIDRPHRFVSLPFGIARIMAGLAQYAPGAPLTPGQVEMLKSDNIVSQSAEDSRQTLSGLDVQATALSAILPKYLVRFRKHGQFQANRGL